VRRPPYSMEVFAMKIAVPLADGKLSLHFGHCDAFAFIDADPDAKKILKRTDVTAPEHQPGLLPEWLAGNGVTIVIAGGMGVRAQQLFAQKGITVVVGAPCDTPESLADAYLVGTLKTGGNACDH